jgi:hypothetical protein
LAEEWKSSRGQLKSEPEVPSFRWTLTQFRNEAESGSAEASYFTFVDWFNTSAPTCRWLPATPPCRLLLSARSQEGAVCRHKAGQHRADQFRGFDGLTRPAAGGPHRFVVGNSGKLELLDCGLFALVRREHEVEVDDHADREAGRMVIVG